MARRFTLLFGNAATATVGSVSRVPAPDIDDQVRKVILEPKHRQLKATGLIDNAFARTLIERIEVRQNRLVVQLKQNPDNPAEEDHSIVIPWIKPPSKRARSILRPTSAKVPLRPIKLERRATLVAAIARGRRWLDELITDSATNARAIATRERCSLRHVNMTLSLAFLSPALTKAAVEGRLPRGVGLEQLRELPLEWDRQFETLGLDPI
ncbi:resolvase [Nitrobacter sp. Nb-311A]|uniref:resolvase n=1 Tax=Nitrobacter sp. Nb-311A TaxID=314253 RepID=UPI000324BAC1|nr:resolvase [Nitrobacter sp. Nb-311A]